MSTNTVFITFNWKVSPLKNRIKTHLLGGPVLLKKYIPGGICGKVCAPSHNSRRKLSEELQNALAFPTLRGWVRRIYLFQSSILAGLSNPQPQGQV